MNATNLPPPPAVDERKLALHYAGIHLQEDRDSRQAVRAANAEKHFWHMIRVRVPGGVLLPGQYLALDALAHRATSNRSLRVTAGQSIQLHGVPEEELNTVQSVLREAGLAAGCSSNGLEYAIAVPPAPFTSGNYLRMRDLAAELCEELYPVPGEAPATIPSHSPRKFTVALALPEDNSANILASDLGFLLMGDGRVNVYAGGSLSMPTKRPDTYARLASPIGSADSKDVLPIVGAVSDLFITHGNIASRRHIRLKYVIDELGLERFRSELEDRLGFAFSDPVPTSELKIPSAAGVHDSGNGEFFYGIGIPWGRIQDAGMHRYKSALRLIVENFKPLVILSPDQNVILSGLRLPQIEAIERILAAFNIPGGAELSHAGFAAMACAGLPTCPLAVAESERVAPQVLAALEQELQRLGRAASPFTFRISGCAIGCIRPNMADLGAIGRKPGHYDLYIGGSESKSRIGELYAESVPLAEIVSAIQPLLEFWAEWGSENETFSDFHARWFGNGTIRNRLARCEASPVRDHIEKQIAAQGYPAPSFR